MNEEIRSLKCTFYCRENNPEQIYEVVVSDENRCLDLKLDLLKNGFCVSNLKSEQIEEAGIHEEYVENILRVSLLVGHFAVQIDTKDWEYLDKYMFGEINYIK